MSKRKIGLLLILSSGYMMAIGCSLFGPLRLTFNSLLGNLGGLFGGS